MDRLFKICSPSKQVLLSQIIFLKKKVEIKGGSLELVHKFLIHITIDNQHFYLKINSFDNEFYLFTNGKPLLFFNSFPKVRKWFADESLI
jgi:hypothetical protein